MMINIVYVILALMGLNLLVFIHELGHYIVARREGMRVEVFSIGFGKPLVSWTYQGVKWQLCPLLFGGYVKIAGMEKEGDLEPYEVPNGFYSKKPWARIKVALAGPIVNLVFAVIVFAVIWSCGGRFKPFSEFTKLIGYIDPQSELYVQGVRPGDEITNYNGKPFSGYKDLIYAAIMSGAEGEIEGNKIDYFTHQKFPYSYALTPYGSPYLQGLNTVGVLAPASYLIYQGAILPNTPIEKSGIELQDRIVWVNGELIFSNEHLSRVLNNGKALLTIEREGNCFLAKIPRVPIEDLRLTPHESIELDDWKHEANLHHKDLKPLYIPYILSSDLYIEQSVAYVNNHSALVAKTEALSGIDKELLPGDRIIAVDGMPVTDSVTLLQCLQKPKAQIIVQKDVSVHGVSWQEEDQTFRLGVDWNEIVPIMQGIGRKEGVKSNGPFRLLHAVEPIRLKDFPLPDDKRMQLDKQLDNQRKQAEKIADPEQRSFKLEQLDQAQNRFMLGAAFQDQMVVYNPQPIALFNTVFQEIFRNLVGLFSGYFSPKHFGGPIFIVQVMQESWGLGFKEVLFWLGAISLNLGFLNLLPIPVLDGGHICLSIVEAIRKKPLTAKTMQRLILPFVALLIFLFIYLTYNDLTRILGRFF